MPSIWWAISSAGMCSLCENDELRRAAAALGRSHDRPGVGRGRLGLLVHPCLRGQQLAPRLVAGRPAAGRREGDHAARAPPGGELERDEAAHGVAGHVRGLEAGLVHRPLDGVDHAGGARPALERRPAGVAGQRRGEHVVVALERGEHELPDPPRVGEAVQEHERRALAAAVRGREGDVHRR
jgi:hypothetical protein